MTTQLPKTCIAILLIALFAGVLIAGCITPPEMTNNLSNATTVSQQNADFPVLISNDGWPPPKTPTNIIAKNFSEIVANNYADIPNLLEMDNICVCGYTPESDYSKVAEVALHDPRIQKVLRDNGVIQGMFIFGPPHYPKNEDPCKYVYATLEFIYRGQHEMALINETTSVVILDPGLEQNLTERFG